MRVSSQNLVIRAGNNESGAKLVRFSKIFGGIMLLAFASTSATTLWAADESTSGVQDRDMLVTEYRGRPPFKRQFVSSEEIAELARFEESASRPTGDSVRVADYRGRPPFKREILSTEEIAELARFEETSAPDTDRRTRRGPPGKLRSRR